MIPVHHLQRPPIRERAVKKIILRDVQSEIAISQLLGKTKFLGLRYGTSFGALTPF
jgi:hypothetical protein